MPTAEEKIDKLWDKQIRLQEEMQTKGFNIVTCGNCETLIIHKTKNNKDTVKCHGCGRKISKSDCPDYYYEGMPKN